MFTIHILIILLNFGDLTSSQDRHNRAARVQCKESIKTVVEVRTCPKDKEARDERARLKECGNVPHNCSDTPLSYHCVLDEFGHGLVEVCAMWTEIIGGECAEFTPGGMFIQEHYENSCRSCPFAYNSSMAYLYGECYGFAVFGITTDGRSTQQQTETGFTDMPVSAANNYSQPKESIDFRIVVAGLIVPVAVVGGLMFLFYILEHRSKKKKAQYSEDVLNTLLNKDNDGDKTHGDKGCTSSEMHSINFSEEVEDKDNEDTSEDCTSLQRSLINCSEEMEDIDNVDKSDMSKDFTSSGKPLIHCTEEVEDINNGRLRVLPSGHTLYNDTPEKKAMPSSSDEMPDISLNEELNEKQAQECRVLLEDLNEEIDDTIKQSEHCEVTDETLHEHLVKIFEHSYIFPETSEGLKKTQRMHAASEEPQELHEQKKADPN